MFTYFVKENLFLIDGIGAAISAILLIMIVAPFASFFGLPKEVIFTLSILPISYCIFSLTCHWIKPKSPIFIKIISVANVFYCLATIGLFFYFYPSITIYGILYFFIEKVIVIPLAIWEWKVAHLK